MKVLVLSDIHSNICSLRAIVTEEPDADRVICAGDVVDFGPFPRQVVAWLEEHDVTCVRGNHDQGLIRLYRQMQEETRVLPNNIYSWAYHNACQLTDNDMEFIRQLPECLNFIIDDVEYILKHRYTEDYTMIADQHQFDLFWEKNSLIQSGHKRRIIFGHTHRQGIYRVGSESLWLNPGSASYRRPDDPGSAAQYIVIEDGVIQLKTLDYDRSPLLKAAEEIDLIKSHYEKAEQFWG